MALAAAPGCGFNSNPMKPGADAGPGGVDAPGGGGGDDGGVGSDGGAVPVPDGPPGNSVCYGPSGWQVCMAAKPTGQVQLQGTLNTDRSDAQDPCLKNQPAGWTTAQPEACFVVGDTITVASLSVTGTRPLVLVAETSITVTGLLDAASHRAGGAVGPGAASAGDCKPFGGAPAMGPPGGGGAGGGFMLAGGDGGRGNGATDMSTAGGKAAGVQVGAPTRLRGGCAGQPGGGGNASDGGAGGGAVYLVSAGTISVTGKIDVSGAGGAGQNALHGAGGGGSGGMIVLLASSISTMQSTLLVAGGGGGGGGSSAPLDVMQNTTRGGDGHEPVLTAPIAPAVGGAGGFDGDFSGGDGGLGYPVPSNMTFELLGATGGISAGGGGGGGGGGYIRSSQDLGAATVSPAADIKP